MSKKALFPHDFYVTRPLFWLSTIAQKSQQSASRWRVLAFYRIAPCLNYYITNLLNRMLLCIKHVCDKVVPWTYHVLATCISPCTCVKVIPNYKQMHRRGLRIVPFWACLGLQLHRCAELHIMCSLPREGLTFVLWSKVGPQLAIGEYSCTCNGIFKHV